MQQLAKGSGVILPKAALAINDPIDRSESYANALRVELQSERLAQERLCLTVLI